MTEQVKTTIMNMEIKNRWTGAVIHKGEFENLKDLVADAIARRISLSYANLSYANLSRADLSCADLSYANLSRADLSCADLSCADLSYANLSRADLSYANLNYANLSHSNLRCSNLSRADLSHANLSHANLSDSDLQPIRDDFWAVLCSAPREVAGLRQALIGGRVDGSTYTGECACLVGTIANVRHEKYEQLGILKPISSRLAERWFLGIGKGETPDNSETVKITLEWLDMWVEQMTSAFGEPLKEMK